MIGYDGNLGVILFNDIFWLDFKDIRLDYGF